MKTKNRILLGLFAISIIALNLTIKNGTSTQPELSIRNIQSLKASATEYFCDMTNANCCDYPWVVSTGKLICYP
jgi:hypothetical protein